MLRVLSDVLTAAAAQQVTLLGHLDLSAAFDCVDHQLLLQRLRRDCIPRQSLLGRRRLSPAELGKGCLPAVQPIQYEQVPQDLSLAPYCFKKVKGQGDYSAHKSSIISR